MSSSVGKGKHKSSTSSSIIVFCIATYAATVLQCAGLARQRCSTQPPGQNHFRCLREKKTHTHTCQAVILAQQGQPWQDQESKKEFPFWAVEWKVGRMPPPVTLSLHFRALFFFFLLPQTPPSVTTWTWNLVPEVTHLICTQDEQKKRITRSVCNLPRFLSKWKHADFKGSKCFENVSSPETNDESAHRSAAEQKGCLLEQVRALLMRFGSPFLTISSEFGDYYNKGQWWWSFKWSSNAMQWCNSSPAETKLGTTWNTSNTNCYYFFVTVGVSLHSGHFCSSIRTTTPMSGYQNVWHKCVKSIDRVTTPLVLSPLSFIPLHWEGDWKVASLPLSEKMQRKDFTQCGVCGGLN